MDNETYKKTVLTNSSQIQEVVVAPKLTLRALALAQKLNQPGKLNRNILPFVRSKPDTRFKNFLALMNREINLDFRIVTIIGRELAYKFYLLHSQGYCFSDFSFDNVYFDPSNGETTFLDNNCILGASDTSPVINSDVRLIAPELLRSEAQPSKETDLYTLAVMLFYLLFTAHPLEGSQEHKIAVFDLMAAKMLYGYNPIFIYDPINTSNRPVPGVHDNAIVYWEIYPTFLKDYFIQAFTKGLKDGKGNRVTELEWISVMVRLTDSLIACSECGKASFFFDQEAKGGINVCWYCKRINRLPLRLHFPNYSVCVNSDSKLYPYHLSNPRIYDFSRELAIFKPKSNKVNNWQIQNKSEFTWTVTFFDGSIKTVKNKDLVDLVPNSIINFGNINGHVIV